MTIRNRVARLENVVESNDDPPLWRQLLDDEADEKSAELEPWHPDRPRPSWWRVLEGCRASVTPRARS